MPKYNREQAKLVSKETGEEFLPGSTITSFRDEDWTFSFVSQLPVGNSEGKIIVTTDPSDPFKGQEYYPGVFEAKIVTSDA